MPKNTGPTKLCKYGCGRPPYGFCANTCLECRAAALKPRFAKRKKREIGRSIVSGQNRRKATDSWLRETVSTLLPPVNQSKS